VTASGEMPLPVHPDPAGLPGGKHHGAGEVNTLVDLYRHHQQRIYRYCLALLRNPDDAEDATQETFTRAAPFLPNLPGDLSAYLTTVARNICCDVVRARSRRVVPIDNVPLADRAVSPERQSVDWDVVRRMWRQLSPSERLLFAYTFAGYKYEEIASRTGMSRPSVSVGLARARRRLRDLAAATGTLVLLPPAIRRLVERISRRANSALASAQGTVLSLADQVGTIAVSLLTGLLAATTTAAVAGPAFLPTAQRVQAPSPRASVAQVDRAGATSAAAHLSQAPNAGRPAAPAPAASALSPLVRSAATALPGNQTAPSDVNAGGVTTSPSYQTDHTIYVWGDINDQASCLFCPELFRTTDNGVSWTHLGTGPYVGGTILLPPTYPRDQAIFAISEPSGLWESSSGDGTFTQIVPGAFAAGISPDSQPGNARIAAVVSGTVVLYEAGTQNRSVAAVLPANFVGTGVAFTAPNSLVVAGYQFAAAGPSQIPAVVTCSVGGACSLPTQFLDPNQGIITVVPSPDVFSDHVVALYTGDTLLISRDGGSHFAVVWRPSSGSLKVVSIGQGPAGLRVVASRMDPASQVSEGVDVSEDLGQSFTSITGDLDASMPVLSLNAYPDGSILAGLSMDKTGHFGLRQTTGNGIWTKPS
jgi:RNA polymerase sigma factor (sigma-70 family)